MSQCIFMEWYLVKHTDKHHFILWCISIKTNQYNATGLYITQVISIYVYLGLLFNPIKFISIQQEMRYSGLLTGYNQFSDFTIILHHTYNFFATCFSFIWCIYKIFLRCNRLFVSKIFGNTCLAFVMRLNKSMWSHCKQNCSESIISCAYQNVYSLFTLTWHICKQPQINFI